MSVDVGDQYQELTTTDTGNIAGRLRRWQATSSAVKVLDKLI